MFSTQHIANLKVILIILSYFISGYQCACYGGGVRCYTVHSGNFKYAQALSGCQGLGGLSIVEVTSPQIQTDLETELQGQTGDYYIGLTDSASEASYVWESGVALTWENWSASYRNSPGQNCVVLSGSDGFKWTNKNCKNKASYICSNNVDVPETTTVSTTLPTTTTSTTTTPTTTLETTTTPTTTLETTTTPTTTLETTTTPTTTVETTTTPTTTVAATTTPTTTLETTTTPTTTVETTTTPTTTTATTTTTTTLTTTDTANEAATGTQTTTVATTHTLTTTVATTVMITANEETTESIDNTITNNTTNIRHNSTDVPIFITPQIGEELQILFQELDEISKTAEANRLRRTQISIVDDRPSSRAIGYFGVIILSTIGFIIFIIDIPNYRRDFKILKRNLCGS